MMIKCKEFSQLVSERNQKLTKSSNHNELELYLTKSDRISILLAVSETFLELSPLLTGGCNN